LTRFKDNERRDIFYAIGDFVLLHSKNLRLEFDGSKKRRHRLFGPFEVVSKISPAAYELTIPAKMQMHDVFHVSLLNERCTEDWMRGDQLMLPPPALLFEEVEI
jgi:hypothetical protein